MSHYQQSLLWRTTKLYKDLLHDDHILTTTLV